MRNGKVSVVLALVVIGLAGGSCGKKKSDKKAVAAPDTKSVLSRIALSRVNLAQSFDANTPKSFQLQSGFNLLDAASECITSANGDTAKQRACVVIADLNERFFQSEGPTIIRNRLADFDKRLNGTIEAYSEMYAPCFDSTRTTAGDFEIMKPGGSEKVTFAPFALLAVPLKSTFLNGLAFDSGQTIRLSCRDESNGMKLAYGNDHGTWSMFESDGASEYHGLFGTADAKDNFDIWFVIGNPSRDALQSGLEVDGAHAQLVYPNSTVISNIISRPAEGVVGISMVGAGVGPGCGSRLVMNDKTAYFAGNVNNYGACTATDFDRAGYGGSPTHDSTRDNTTYCLDVSGSTPVLADEQACYDSGLLSKDDDGSMVDPFIQYGLKKMTADMDSTNAEFLKARAWMGGFFMKDTDLSSVAPLGGVKADTKVNVTVTGYSTRSWLLERTTAVADQKTSVQAACSATTGMTDTLTESFEFDFAALVAQIKSQAATPPADDAVLVDFNASMANTGDAVPYLEVPVSRTRGATYRGNVDGSISVKLDEIEVATGTITVGSDVTDPVTTVKIPLTGATFTATSKLTVSLSGTLTLSCDNAIGNIRTVAAKPGLPRLVWFGKEKLQTAAK